MKILILSIISFVCSNCLFDKNEGDEIKEKTLYRNYDAYLIKEYYEPQDVDEQVILSRDTIRLPNNLLEHVENDPYFNIDSIIINNDSLKLEFREPLDSASNLTTISKPYQINSYMTIFPDEHVMLYKEKIREHLPNHLHAYIDESTIHYSSCIVMFKEPNGEYYGHTIYSGLTCSDYQVFKDIVNGKLNKKAQLEEFHKIELEIEWK
jgi:hypothetical protein